VAHDWERLRTTFDAAAELYQQARPEYPEPLYDTLVDLTGVGAGEVDAFALVPGGPTRIPRGVRCTTPTLCPSRGATLR